MVRLDGVGFLVAVIRPQAHAAHLHALPAVELLPAVPPPGGGLRQGGHHLRPAEGEGKLVGFQ